MLEAIRDDRAWARTSWTAPTICVSELHLAANTEMVAKLEDFIRRRSKIDLVVGDDIPRSQRPHEVAEILFGDDADHQLEVLHREGLIFSSASADRGPPNSGLQTRVVFGRELGLDVDLEVGSSAH